ncbi:MAG: PQQ-like beta-propeller repeat protein, partial [Planctomycetales bacterium]
PKQRYYAFDKASGDLLWIGSPGGTPKDTNYSVPIVAVVNGVRMLIGGNSDGGVHAMNARTGEHIWSFKMSRRGLNASIVIDGNYVYAAHGEDNIDNTEFGRVQCIDATGKGDVTKTHSVWRHDGIKAGYASLLVKDGILYVISDNGKLNAYDSKKGDKLWDYALGTVGKGSPVWAEGKLYVMEVNGRVHVLKPSREKCEEVSMVHLPAGVGTGDDEIYASPAISNGRVVIVSRDRTICLHDAAKEWKDGEPLALPEEKPAGDKVAHLKLIPHEVLLNAGESVEYVLQGFDENGRFVKNIDGAALKTDALEGASVEGMKVVSGNGDAEQAGHVLVEVDGLQAKARVRVYPKLTAEKPWKWTFDGLKGTQIPVTWLNAFLKMKPLQIEDETVLRVNLVKGRPSVYTWIGKPDMTNYTVQADFKTTEQRRQMSNVGLTVNRYNFIMMGNRQKLRVQSWAPHRRMTKEVKYRWDPEVWYTMKFRVDVDDKGAHVKGKVWKRGEKEPDAWSLQADDPHPNKNGSPGLYFYAMTESFVDNVIVSPAK